MVASGDDTTEVIGSCLLPGASRYGKPGCVREVIQHARNESGAYDIVLRADAGSFLLTVYQQCHALHRYRGAGRVSVPPETSRRDAGFIGPHPSAEETDHLPHLDHGAFRLDAGVERPHLHDTFHFPVLQVEESQAEGC